MAKVQLLIERRFVFDGLFVDLDHYGSLIRLAVAWGRSPFDLESLPGTQANGYGDITLMSFYQRFDQGLQGRDRRRHSLSELVERPPPTGSPQRKPGHLERSARCGQNTKLHTHQAQRAINVIMIRGEK